MVDFSLAVTGGMYGLCQFSCLDSEIKKHLVSLVDFPLAVFLSTFLEVLLFLFHSF